MELPQPAQSSRPVVADEPLAPRRFEIDERRSPWGWLFLLVVLAGAAAVYFNPALLDRVKALIPAEIIEAGEDFLAGTSTETVEESPAPVAPAADRTVDEVEEVEAPDVSEPVVAETIDDDAVELPAEATVDEALPADDAVAEEASAIEPDEQTVAEFATDEIPAEPQIDEAQLLPADLTVGLVATGQFVPEIEVTLREDAGNVTIDLVRMHNMREPLTVLLEEVGFSGNRSPWEEGQYVIANNGVATFAAGQSRVRTGISMSSDSMREQDRDVTIQVREIDNAGHEFARINLRLEDDDRRAYEASLPVNTIAFAASEMFVSEADPAVQIDVVRFKPSNTAIEVRYKVNDLTTTAGEDYFPPGDPTIRFSPNQRSARILIPLVQDADPEDSEVFALEFANPALYVDPEIYQSIAIMIRDDD